MDIDPNPPAGRAVASPKYRLRSKDLTPERILVLESLISFHDENSYPPSIRELATILNRSSPATVHAHLESLERQGLVERIPRAARGWRATRGGLHWGRAA